MSRSKNDDAPGAPLPGQEMTDEQLSLVLGAAAPTVLPRQAFGQQPAVLSRNRVPVINPERTLPPLYRGFDLAEIHPDLEDPFPKPEPNPPPKDPPIPPDLEDPFPRPAPTDFPLPGAFQR